MTSHTWYDVTSRHSDYEEEICVDHLDCRCGLMRRRPISPHLRGSDHSSVKVRNTGEWEYVNRSGVKASPPSD